MKALYRIAIVGLLFCLLACLAWLMEKPSFNVKEILVDQISGGDLRITLKVEADNPNRFDLTLTALTYTFTLDQRQVAKGALATEVHLPASARSMIDLPVTAHLSPTGGLLKSIFSARESTYKIEGTAHVSTAFGGTEVPFSGSGSFRLKKP
jgi:LEA14-like dessication related protein